LGYEPNELPLLHPAIYHVLNEQSVGKGTKISVKTKNSTALFGGIHKEATGFCFFFYTFAD
jgi:hypothetical protein